MGRATELLAPDTPADVCLIIEGAYPYVRGGVSSWVHDLIQSQCHLRFHLLVVAAPDAELTPHYSLPANVCGLTQIFVQELAPGPTRLPGARALLRALHDPVSRLMARGELADLQLVCRELAPFRGKIGRRLLLDSRSAWRSFNEVYGDMCDDASYLNAFWGWRSLVAGLYSMVLADLPDALVYHAISTGYAGLLAARANLETGRPVIVTEHGVYTNERRLEILAAPWLAIDDSASLSVDGDTNKVKQLWISTFSSYSRACYAACTSIITLFEGNHPLQVEDGADPDRLCVIPNGIDLPRYGAIKRSCNRAEGGERPPAVALVGRVVPIKDIKTYIRACALLVRRVPDVHCYILGPMEEDPAYAASCQELVAQCGLQDHVEFTGMADLLAYFGKIDVVVLTSISESQPLVILKAGAAGVPAVATDVGSCAELINGRSDEQPSLGAAGRVTAIGNPAATANALAELLLDEPKRQACGEVARQRVAGYYDKVKLHERYAELYESLRLQRPDVAAMEA